MAKVLLIEDEKAMSDLVALKFKVEGFEVDQAFNLAEAKEKLATSTYDAILTDYLLPDGDLVDFLTNVRADPKWQDLPVVVMTNYIEDVNKEQFDALKVAEAIVKYQVVPAQMVEKIKTLIQNNPNPVAPSVPAPEVVPAQPVAEVSVPAVSAVAPALEPTPQPVQEAPQMPQGMPPVTVPEPNPVPAPVASPVADSSENNF